MAIAHHHRPDDTVRIGHAILAFVGTVVALALALLVVVAAFAAVGFALSWAVTAGA